MMRTLMIETTKKTRKRIIRTVVVGRKKHQWFMFKAICEGKLIIKIRFSYEPVEVFLIHSFHFLSEGGKPSTVLTSSSAFSTRSCYKVHKAAQAGEISSPLCQPSSFQKFM